MPTVKRLEAITPFLVMDVLERAQAMESAGVDVVHFEVGEPDFDAPSCVKDAGRESLARGHTHYTHSLGTLELREAISRRYTTMYNMEVPPERIIVTMGTSPAMLLSFSALLEPGDEVILTDPHYACYPNFIRYCGGVPVTVPVSETDGFALDMDRVRCAVTPKTKAIIVNSPSNPTGAVLSAETLRECAGLGCHVVSDEIYHGLVYGETAHTLLEFTDQAFVVDGFSKRYAMTGFRLGYLIAPEEYVRPMQILQQNFFISAASVVQDAGIAALESADADVARMTGIYDERRRFMIDGLRRIGFTITREPAGAFYVFVDARHIDRDSYRLAFDILDNAHVGVTPGVDFGSNGEGFLRFSYAVSRERIAEGLDRLARYFGRRGNY